MDQSSSVFFSSVNSQCGQLQGEDSRTWRSLSSLFYLDAERKASWLVDQWFHTEKRTKKKETSQQDVYTGLPWIKSNLPQHWPAGDLALSQNVSTSRCGSCFGGNKNYQVFRKFTLGKHWAFALESQLQGEGNLCFPHLLQLDLVQRILRQNYLGLY